MMFRRIQMPRTTELDNELARMEVDGYPFHVCVVGDPSNPPLVVVHGGPGGDMHYLRALDVLSDQFRVLYYDQRMTGLSSRKSEKEPGIDQDLSDLHAVIEQFAGDKQVDIVGHSYGGMLATGYLSLHPERVRKAVIIEPGVLHQESAKEFVRGLKAANSFGQLFKVIGAVVRSLFVKKEDGHEKMDFVITSVAGTGKGPPYQCEGVSLPKGSFVRSSYAVMQKTSIPLIKNPDSIKIDLTTKLAEFGGEVLLLSSSCSFIGYEFQEKHHRRFFPPQTEHRLLEQTGHNFLTTDPDRTIPVIRAFLQASGAARA